MNGVIAGECVRLELAAELFDAHYESSRSVVVASERVVTTVALAACGESLDQCLGPMGRVLLPGEAQAPAMQVKEFVDYVVAEHLDWRSRHEVLEDEEAAVPDDPVFSGDRPVRLCP